MSMIIAEVGANHLAHDDLIRQHIDEAAAAGAHFVKFQSWQADKLIKTYPNYEKEYQYYKAHELSDRQCELIMEYTGEIDILPLFTIFDLERVDFIASLNNELVKVASPDANSWSLLGKCFEKFDHVIISTGMHYIPEVDDLVKWLEVHDVKHRSTLMHCSSVYPTPHNKANLQLIEAYRKRYNMRVGYSDHTVGIEAAFAAAALDAEYIEKHFTISTFLNSRDALHACTTEELHYICTFNNYCSAMIDRNVGSPTLIRGDLPGAENRQKYIGRWGNNK